MAMSARFAMTIMKSLLAKHIGPLKEFVQATSVLLIRSSSLTCLRTACAHIDCLFFSRTLCNETAHVKSHVKIVEELMSLSHHNILSRSRSLRPTSV